MKSFFPSDTPDCPASRARRLHQQRHGAELVEREEACVRRAGLYRERRLELQHVEEIGRRKPAGGRKAKQLERVRAGLQQRRRRQRRQRHDILDRADASNSCCRST